MITFLIILAIIVVYSVIHAYGMGRYIAAKENSILPENIKHKGYCNMATNWKNEPTFPSIYDKGCNQDCLQQVVERQRDKVIFSASFWPITWPLQAAYARGQKKGKFFNNPNLMEAFNELEHFLERDD